MSHKNIFYSVLTQIPATLRNELIKSFNQIVRCYREMHWEPSELNGGKLCEVVYTVLKGRVDGHYPSKASKPRNMVDACKNLEQETSFSRSIRIQIPRMIVSLYEIRNNRGVCHVGGDVDPNHMDATVVLYMAKWIMSELVRIFHNIDVQSATEVVEHITDRTLPIIWCVEDKVRILNTDLTMLEKTLLVLYFQKNPVGEIFLVTCVEHTNPSVYRRDVLKKAHKKKLIEYDQSNKLVYISPKGINQVEESIDINNF